MHQRSHIARHIEASDVGSLVKSAPKQKKLWVNTTTILTTTDIKHSIDPQLEVIRLKTKPDSYIEATLFLDDSTILIQNNKKREYKRLNTCPINPSGVTLIPVRGVQESFGGIIEWDSNNKIVHIKRNEIEVILRIDSGTALINGQETIMAEPARIINNSTLIPLRFVSENLGFKVDWVESEKKIKIYTN